MDMDLGDVIGFVALIAAAASLYWQRHSSEEQSKTLQQQEQEKLKQLKREIAVLTTQTLALATANATKYARLESRISRLLSSSKLTTADRSVIDAQANRIKQRLDAYNQQADDAADNLRQLRADTSGPDARPRFEAWASAISQQNSYLERTQSEESRAIEDEIARLEQQLL